MYYTSINKLKKEKKKHKGKLTKRQALTVMGWWAITGAMLKADAILTRLHFTAFPKVQSWYRTATNIFLVLCKHCDPVFYSDQHKYGGQGQKKNPSFSYSQRISSISKEMHKNYINT